MLRAFLSVPLEKKRMMCSTGALLCSQMLVSLRHRRPPANARCIGCFLIMLQVTGHAGGVPIASPRGRSVSFPFSGNYGYICNLRRSYHGQECSTCSLISGNRGYDSILVCSLSREHLYCIERRCMGTSPITPCYDVERLETKTQVGLDQRSP